MKMLHQPEASIAVVLLFLALIALIGGSIYASSVWFYAPPLGEDPDKLYRPVNELLGWFLAGGGTWLFASIAMLVTRSASAKRSDYRAFVVIGSVIWLACAVALNLYLGFPGVYSIVILALGDALIVYAIVRYIITRHILSRM